MPHVIVKLYPDKSEQPKSRLAERITKAVMTGANCAERSVSVTVQDIEPSDGLRKSISRTLLAIGKSCTGSPGYNPL